MYNRPTAKDITKWHKEFGKDRLFQNLHSALSVACRQTVDITPEEIWALANEYVKEIVQNENDLFEIDALPNNLFFRLSDYKNENSRETKHREPDDAKHLVFLVQFVILYQLTRYQRNWENHPYKNYCIAIVEQIRSNPLLEQLIPLVKETNDRYELMYGGKELEPHDYLPFVYKENATTNTDEQKPDTSKTKHIRLFAAAMREMQMGIYCEKPLESNIKRIYDWYAVYRLAKDKGLITNYDEFIEIMEGDEWKQKPNSFQNILAHKNAISDDSIFPDWICVYSGEEKRLKKFLHIAKATYEAYTQGCIKAHIEPF